MGFTNTPSALPPLFILSQDVNYHTAVATALLKSHLSGKALFNPRKLIGVPTLAVYKARTLLAAACRRDPFDIDLSVVVGGTVRSGVPLLQPFGNHFGMPDSWLHCVARDVGSVVGKGKRGEENAKGRSGEGGRHDVASAEKGEGRGANPENGEDGQDSEQEGDLELPYALAFSGFELVVSYLKALRGDQAISECLLLEQSEPVAIEMENTNKSNKAWSVDDAPYSEEALHKARSVLASLPLLCRRVALTTTGIGCDVPITSPSAFEMDQMVSKAAILRQDLRRAGWDVAEPEETTSTICEAGEIGKSKETSTTKQVESLERGDK